MKHSRKDYNRIQDPEGKIPEDEPVFLLRAQDEIAPIIVMQWAMLYEQNNGDKKLVELAKNQARDMLEWQIVHGYKKADLVNQPKEKPIGVISHCLEAKMDIDKPSIPIDSNMPCLDIEE